MVCSLDMCYHNSHTHTKRHMCITHPHINTHSHTYTQTIRLSIALQLTCKSLPIKASANDRIVMSMLHFIFRNFVSKETKKHRFRKYSLSSLSSYLSSSNTYGTVVTQIKRQPTFNPKKCKKKIVVF